MEATDYSFYLLYLSPLYLFIPLSMVTYLLIQHRNKRKQIEQFVAKTNIQLDESFGFGPLGNGEKGPTEGLTYRHWFDYMIPVVLATIVVAGGLHVVLFMTPTQGSGDCAYLLGHYFGDSPRGIQTCQVSLSAGSWAFLGSYIFSLQYIFRRYVAFDLYPRVYYDVTIRIFYTVTIALAIRFLSEDLATSSAAPALFFTIGTFPERGLTYIDSKLGRLVRMSKEKDLRAQNYSLSMIEGISLLHRTRLKELGIDNVQNLASANFIDLMMRTPFNEEVLINWVLEAKLVVIIGEKMSKLRDVGIYDAISFRKIIENEDVGIAGLEKTTGFSPEVLHIAYVQICNDDGIADLVNLRTKSLAF